MENSGHFMSSKWFNTKLFTINGAPLKFYLDGYSVSEFYEIVKIIKAYGGELSKPGAPDTFVFCDPDRLVGAGKYDNYDINFFYDSIAALQPQELINYKLQVFQKQGTTSVTNRDRPTHSENEEENYNDSEESMDFMLRISTDEETDFVDDDKSLQLNSDGDHHDKPQESLDNTLDEGPVNHRTDEGMTKSKVKEEKIRRNSCPSGPEVRNKLSAKRRSYATVEAAVSPRKTRSSLKNDGLKENGVAQNTNPRINDQNNNNSDEVNRSSCQNRSEDEGDSDGSEVSQTPEDSDPPRGESNEGISLRARRSSTVGDKRIGRRSIVTFTEEENEAIIQWLVDRNVIPTDTGKKLWLELIDEKVLPNRQLTPSILLGHFKRELKEHPTFKKYSNNSPSGGRIAPQHMSNRYTEEENRVLIQYLIDNDSVHRAKGFSIWRECLKDCKHLLNPMRTVNSLCTHFKQKLRYNYAKYTDDPEALEIFKKIEPKSRE
ncbi:uncharacterized protein LOC107039523 [Diachasma alloeum]|uniref:uncharacterized protein LOC107039523 n=1 Tax=Diachasma alloeum TaxID=454923 RepID=UPI0007383307|nr:uncharacterized protein LOC107039523 [Diachasma alloeum]XP_015114654.1 uncharacterized protein LOC107039523 [Diachasma alloeum]XP_015114655.1 uncharacterized protein LOC107039523 [Diachasma alloeum]XP_015114656.1 uncharacterized protein LOC107039523 [Diachasma alloeum]XP_015114657.1 uncharacterized protein LOC107039523 [Diachasma alloeum]